MSRGFGIRFDISIKNHTDISKQVSPFSGYPDHTGGREGNQAVIYQRLEVLKFVREILTSHKTMFEEHLIEIHFPSAH